MLQAITSFLTEFRARAPQLDGPKIERADPCGFCGSRKALQLSRADYWDLMEVDLVRCRDCGLIQVDPMLTAEATAIGCLALYRFQQSGESDRSRRRGLYRAFRRGIAFGMTLRLDGIKPTRVLEVGAGDGYFLKGLQYVFPSASYTCLDVVEEILEAMQQQHGFSTIASAVEDMNWKTLPKFDLVIARDILEHVTKPARALETLTNILVPGGTLFFITPNGWQDAWQMFSRWNVDHVRSEILINHVNYFDAISLREKIESFGLTIRKWYIYDLKTFFRGAGWKLIEQHKARVSSKRPAKQTIEQSGSLSTTFAVANRQPIPKSYESPLLRPLLMLYCWYKHTSFLRVNADTRVGEEIYCLAQKSS